MRVFNRQNSEAFLVFFFLVAILTLAASTFGLTWDESSYFKFFDSIRLWFLNNRSFDPATLAAFWDYSAYHNPHPPFMKIIGAIFSHFFKDILPYPAGYRLGNIVYVAGCLALCYRLLLTSFTRTAAAAAIVFVCFQPRVFGHLMIAATDSPVAVSWLALTLVGWRLSRTTAASKKTVLRLFLFILLACASATKITGFLVVLPLGAYFLTQQNFRELGWLTGAALFSLLFTVLVFPPDWFQPFTAVKDYLLYPFERSEVAISTFYLGKIYKF